jgi:hypothetical protein
MPYTVHMEMPKFQQVEECDDKRYAMEIARECSLAAMQDFVLVKDDEKEVINIVYRGIVFKISEPKEDY